MSVIIYFDQTILFFIQSLHFLFLDNVMIFMTTLGDGGFIWIMISLLLLINKKTRTIGIVVILALMLSNIIGNGILKNLIDRPRPYFAFPDVKLLVDKLTSSSFPSGHTASSFAAAYVLSYFFKKQQLWWWLLASLIAFSRLYLFVHYPTDIIGGILLGMLCGYLAVMIFEQLNLKKKSNKKTD